MKVNLIIFMKISIVSVPISPSIALNVMSDMALIRSELLVRQIRAFRAI